MLIIFDYVIYIMLIILIMIIMLHLLDIDENLYHNLFHYIMGMLIVYLGMFFIYNINIMYDHNLLIHVVVYLYHLNIVYDIIYNSFF